jgi:hypothetical protein
MCNNQWLEKTSRGNRLKGPDEVSEVEGEHCPDESGKNAVTLPKASLTVAERQQAFEPIRIGCSDILCGEKL